MKLVVVGGHSRNIGKTSVAAAVIAATRELGWTALKITQYGHGICSRDGAPCECAPQNPEHPFSISREEDRAGGGDTSRFLAAGAAESWWVRSPQGRLAEAMPEIERLIGGRSYVLMESNSVVEFLRPDAYLVVLDSGAPDFKRSTWNNLDRAHAFVLVGALGEEPPWEGVSRQRIENRPVFPVQPPRYWSGEVEAFLREKLR